VGNRGSGKKMVLNTMNAEMKTSKKGMFFTIIAIMLILLFMAAYGTFFVLEDRKNINKRIESMNNFVFSMEEDLGRQLYISGSRAVFIVEKYIAENGRYASDTNSLFSEMFFNGTFYGLSQDVMIGATFSDIENSISERAEKINLDVSIRPNFVSISQDNPWSIKITLNANLSITDKTNLASWAKSENYYSYIPIDNFEDPLYTIESGGKIIQKINKTTFFSLVSGSDVSNLLKHLDNSYYYNSELAPSFLQRLEGNISQSAYGIESFVNLPELSSQGIAVEDKSCVDYIYFSDNNPQAFHIAGMPSWFKIDYEHIEVYNVSGLTY
jgi:hypothetical protein